MFTLDPVRCAAVARRGRHEQVSRTCVQTSLQPVVMSTPCKRYNLLRIRMGVRSEIFVKNKVNAEGGGEGMGVGWEEGKVLHVTRLAYQVHRARPCSPSRLETTNREAEVTLTIRIVFSM